MWSKPKDSANSWEQSSWRFALEQHGRLRAILAKITTSDALKARCEKMIADLEQRWPQLKERVEQHQHGKS